MTADLKPSRRSRAGAIAVVALLHLAAAVFIARAFAPDLTAAVANSALSAITVVITPPPPEARPDAGAAAEQARKARPREISAPKRTLPNKPEPLPPVSAKGPDSTSGAAATGAGTGGGGQGIGTGSGAGGTGQGNGAAHGLEMIAGDINSARDYPKGSRDLRIGQSVTILLDVGTDGRVTACHVTIPSPDAAADAITCRLASARFRFRPATDRAGNPVPGRYAWRQRWFY